MAVLIRLQLPAVQKIREAARIECTNDPEQIVLAGRACADTHSGGLLEL